jgi:hypothetical protein
VAHNYSLKKVRGEGTFPGLVIPIIGRATEGIVAAFTNEITSTFTAVDGHGVHTDTDDDESGTIVINLQGGSLTGKLFRQLAMIQKTTGAALIGSLSFTDIGGSGTICTLTECKLSSNPGIAYTAVMPPSTWTFAGKLFVQDLGGPSIPFGLANVVPPI